MSNPIAKRFRREEAQHVTDIEGIDTFLRGYLDHHPDWRDKPLVVSTIHGALEKRFDRTGKLALVRAELAYLRS